MTAFVDGHRNRFGTAVLVDRTLLQNPARYIAVLASIRAVDPGWLTGAGVARRRVGSIKLTVVDGLVQGAPGTAAVSAAVPGACGGEAPK